MPEEIKIFKCYLETLSGKHSEYSVEILANKLVIRSKKGKVKLQFDLHAVLGCKIKLATIKSTPEMDREET